MGLPDSENSCDWPKGPPVRTHNIPGPLGLPDWALRRIAERLNVGGRQRPNDRWFTEGVPENTAAEYLDKIERHLDACRAGYVDEDHPFAIAVDAVMYAARVRESAK